LGIAPSEKIAVVPLGLELGDFLAIGNKRGEAREKGFRASLGISTETFLVGIVGRLVPIKDHETLFEAVRLLIGQGMDVHLAVVGDGERREELEVRAREILTGGYVQFVGWRFDLPDVYTDLDAVALCSLNEGTPVSLIEAMAASRPIVATAVGGVRDLLGSEGRGDLEPGKAKETERGLAVPAQDKVALAAALHQVFVDPEKATERAQAARIFVKERFDVEGLVANLSALYRKGQINVARHVGETYN
jgi:glycosyltransferase involved in cell wall biosynthesis